jgi:hypothetical protein
MACSLVKNMKIFWKWSNCPKSPDHWLNIRRFFISGLIVSGNLPVDKKIQRFFESGLIASSDLPVGEKYEDF